MLPTERAPAPEQSAYRTQPFGTPPLKPATHMERILVVEDDRAVQKALKRLFEAEGLLVEVCGDGKLAVDAFNSFRPSAVILDLRLPGMSGREICHELKQRSPMTPVLVLSAASDVPTRCSCWKSARMTTSPSHSVRGNCWRVCGLLSGETPARAP